MSDVIEMNLLENAIDSLEMALINYIDVVADNQARSYKYCILSLSLYLELSFKYFVRDVHPVLIYKGIFDKRLNKELTITMNESINLLINIGEYVSKENNEDTTSLKSIKHLKNIANQIKHYEFSISREELVNKMSMILFYMDCLYDDHDISIEKKIDSSHEDIYKKIVDDYEHKVLLAEAEACKKAKKYDQASKDSPSIYDSPDILRGCPECCNQTLVLDNDQYFCTFCSHEDIAVECECCSCTFPASESCEEIEGTFWCSDQCLLRSKKGYGCA